MKTLTATLFLVLATGGFAHVAAAADPVAADAAQQEQAAAAPAALEDYAGTYPLAPGFDLVISERDGALYGQATGQPEFPLAHVEDDRFANPAIGVEIGFQRDADGSVAALELRQGGQALRGERQ